jgi:cytoskeletal protein CcmA (bactofilin family)
MFGKKKQPPIRSLIGEGTVIHGDIRFVEGLRIDGEVVGDVTAEPGDLSILVVSEKGRVTGRVKAGHVIISGLVSGPVECATLLELQPKARIVGNVRYEALEMHPGAVIEGELAPIQMHERPPLKLASSGTN